MSVYVLENINEVIDETSTAYLNFDNSICLVNIDRSRAVATGLDTLIGEEQLPTNYH
jgi:hypothetical protein